MKRFLAFLGIAVVLIVSINAKNGTCPSPNEHYQCGTACQKSCESMKRGPGMCTTKCKYGCFCNHGYVRKTDDKSSECVRKECCDNPDCTPTPDQANEPKQKITCPSPNEHYKCGTACQKSCESIKRGPGMCTTKCEYGCFCNRDYIRKTDEPFSECIKKECCDKPDCK